MEIKATGRKRVTIAGFCLYTFVYIALFAATVNAQPPVKLYTVKDGNMYIILSKNISELSLDSFITRYDLHDLGLKQFFQTNSRDVLEQQGWKVETNNSRQFIISKPLKSFKDIISPADKILLTEKQREIGERFPSVSNKIKYGYNRFKNKFPFYVRDAVVTFFLRNNLKARRVMLAGSFNIWQPNDLAMTRTDSGWIAYVKLTPGKFWYKFIIDGHWTPDDDNAIRENDEFGNTNSVYFKTNQDFIIKSFTNAGEVYLAGAFNNWRPRELQMIKTATGWKLPVYLADGTYTYKYVVDGSWQSDPGNPEKMQDELNGFSSVVHIGKMHLFKLNGYKDAKQVMLTGSFNSWAKNDLFMKKTATGWELPYAVGPGNYEYRFIVDGKSIPDPANSRLTNNGSSLLAMEANYTFRLKGYENAKSVIVAGDFNEWNPKTLAMTREGDEWIYRLYLSPGKHRYKFVVDGKWITDPANKQWEQNEFGTGNSILWVRAEGEMQ